MHRTLPCWTLVLVLTSLWLMSHGKAAEAGEPQELIRQTLTGVLAVLTDDTLKPLHSVRNASDASRRWYRQALILRKWPGAPWAMIGIGSHRLNKRNSSSSSALAPAIVGETHCVSGHDQCRRIWQCPECHPVYTRNHRPRWRCVGTNCNDLCQEQTTEDIEYLLLRRNGTWRVYDVVAEGASMVTNYRTQFAQILRQESYNDLIKRLKTSQQ